MGVSHAAEPREGYRLAVFDADVTVPLGHGMMGGAWQSTSVADPLEAHGVVLLGADKPIVLVAVDWCEIRNEAYFRWQTALAAAAGTDPQRVLVTTVHQHDAPVADLFAERLLRQQGAAGSVCDPQFHEQAVQRVAAAVGKSLAAPRRVTHLGMGQARVQQIACNRRYIAPDGAVRFDRTSSTRLPEAIAAPEGLIDPWLKTLSLWDGDTPLVAVSFYAVHPMSYYGAGEVSADFPGLARRRRQQQLPDVKQIYCSAHSGNTTAGKYNTGCSREPRRAGRPPAGGDDRGLDQYAPRGTDRAGFPLGRIAAGTPRRAGIHPHGSPTPLDHRRSSVWPVPGRHGAELAPTRCREPPTADPCYRLRTGLHRGGAGRVIR